MTRLRLAIGNKNYSSWSMRPWVLMKQAGIDFQEVPVRFDSFDADSTFKSKVGQWSPAGRVPILLDGDLAVWDTLAIAEYLAESFPGHRLWPDDKAARARARSVCAEMHSGFGALRSHFPMNIEASLPEIGTQALAEEPAVRADLARIVSMWGELLAQGKGPMLFGGFTIADAFFAPIVMRIRTYGLPLDVACSAYADAVVALPSVRQWIAEACAEHDFLAFEEPYRKR
ncbi:MAG: glutathione S-transferase family protein [Ideonella sp.]